MNKRLFLSLATLPLLGTAGQAEAAKPQDRPNIILFLVDDMGWQDTSLPFWKEKTHYNDRYVRCLRPHRYRLHSSLAIPAHRFAGLSICFWDTSSSLPGGGLHSYRYRGCNGSAN